MNAENAFSLTDGEITDITMARLGKWPSFEAQSWASLVAKEVLITAYFLHNQASGTPTQVHLTVIDPERYGQTIHEDLYTVTDAFRIPVVGQPVGPSYLGACVSAVFISQQRIQVIAYRPDDKLI